MTFNFGGRSFAAEFPTSEALQFEWPNISGISIQSLEIPRMERRRFLEPTRPSTTLSFEVILHSNSEEGIAFIRDQFMLWIDPTLGPQRFILDDDPQWYWDMAVSQEIVWEKLSWSCDSGGFRLRADVVFESYNDAAARLVSETFGPSIISNGNTRSWPTVEFQGTLSASQSARVRLGTYTIDVDGPLASSDTAVLNYDLMRFEVLRGGSKIASLVPRMSTLQQVEIRPQAGPVTFSVTPVSGGSISSALVKANSRKQ